MKIKIRIEIEINIKIMKIKLKIKIQIKIKINLLYQALESSIKGIATYLPHTAESRSLQESGPARRVPCR